MGSENGRRVRPWGVVLVTGVGLGFGLGCSPLLAQSTSGAAEANTDAGGTRQLAPVRIVDDADRGEVTEGSGSYTARRSRAATGLSLSPRETPQSVTIITRGQMDDQNLLSFDDVMEVTPGVSRQNWGDLNSGYVSYYSRGFEINNFQQDGVITSPMQMQGLTGLGNRDMVVYDQVAVVRGATGLLSGAGNPAASINLIRKRPTREFQAAGGMSVGRWHFQRYEADISTPLSADGRVRARLVAAHQGGDSWMVGANSRRGTLYGIIEADLTARTSLRAGVEHGSIRTRWSTMHGYDVTDTDGVPTRFTGFDNPSTKDSYLNLDRTTYFANLDHEFGNGWLARLAVNHSRLDADQIYGVAAWAIEGGTQASGVTYGRAVNTPRQNAVDLSLSGPFKLFGREHELIAGLNYFGYKRDDPSYARQSFDLASIYDFNGVVPSVPFVSNSRTVETNRQIGGYLAARWKPLDGLSIITGGRVTSYVQRTTWEDQRDTGVFTPYLGAVYDLGSHWSTYASYTQIFNPQSSRDVQGRRLDPESGSNMELGLKGSFHEGRLNVAAAVFETRKDDMAVVDGRLLTPEGDQAYRAEDGVKARGIELEVSGQLAPGWQVATGFTHVLIRGKDGQLLNTGYIPKQLFKLFTTWRPGAALPGLTLGGGLTAQTAVFESDSSSYSDAVLAQYRQGGRVVWNLMARYQVSRNFDVSVNLANGGDKRYRTQIMQHNIGAPRNLTVGLRYRI